MKAAKVSETFEGKVVSGNWVARLPVEGRTGHTGCVIDVSWDKFHPGDRVRVTVTRLQPAGKRGKR